MNSKNYDIQLGEGGGGQFILHALQALPYKILSLNALGLDWKMIFKK